MASIAFTLPIVPGKENVDREGLQRMATGDERQAFEDWNRRHGFSRHAVWHQNTPNRTVAVVVFEGGRLAVRSSVGATSDHPFDRRFREFVKEVHGIDLATSPPLDVQQVIDVRV